MSKSIVRKAGCRRPETGRQTMRVEANTVSRQTDQASRASGRAGSLERCNHTSFVLDHLTTSSWCLLKKRIGDDTMFHLLKYASIFLPHSRSNYHQVAGSPIIDLVMKIRKHKSGSRKKRKRVSDEDKYTSDDIKCSERFIDSNVEHQVCDKYTTTKTGKRLRSSGSEHCTQKFNGVKDEDIYKSDTINSLQQSNRSLTVTCCFGSGACSLSCNRRSCFKSFGWGCCRKQSPLRYPEAHMLNCIALENDLVKSNEELKVAKNTTTTMRKRSRPFSWQRLRKRKQFTSLEDKMLPSVAPIHYERDQLSGILQQSSDTSLSHQTAKVVSPPELDARQITSQCFSCLMLQAPRKDPKGAKINKQLMFYKSGCSLSFLPRNHILNKLKPNDSGAVVLMMDIFGLSKGSLSSQSLSCFQGSGRCLTGSACLYHSLLGLLKSLICNARSCNYLKFLDKHCPIPCLDQSTNGNVGTFEDSKSQTNLLDKRHMGFQPKSSLLEGLECHVNRQQEKYLNGTPDVFDYQVEINGQYCQKDQVVSFLWSTCRNIVPPDLLGAPSIWRALRRNISKFVCLRRFESFFLRQCMHGLKTASFPFLSKKMFLCFFSNGIGKDGLGRRGNICKGGNRLSDVKGILKNKLLGSWIYWFFNCLVVPIIYANFYVTESEQGKQEIFYYRKPIWEKVTHTAIDLFEKRSYHLLDNASLRNILSKRAFGFSKVRFCPKEHGVRVLANLKAPSKVHLQGSLQNKYHEMQKKVDIHSKLEKFVCFKSVNYALRDLHVVLKGIKMKCPEKLGSSVFDYSGVYRKLCPFLIDLKNGSGSLPRLFVVICDVSKAFDSVDQDKLLTVMKDVIFSDEYIVDQYAQVFCGKKSLQFRCNQILSDKNISSSVSNFTTPSFFSNPLQSVLINQVSSRNIRKEELCHNLEEHVKSNVLQIGQKFYLQEIGIPQGSILSSLLCSYYYGHMERNVLFPFLNKIRDPCILYANDNLPVEYNAENGSSSVQGGIISQYPKHLLLRFIDDFFFISTSKKKATGFFSRLKRGFCEYNCSMNEKKFCMNFDADHISRFSSKKVYIGEDGISFLPWSGLLINCRTLEIQADYTRYLNIHLGSTLTVYWQVKPGRHLKAKLCAYMRPKCHPIFYDSNINSAAVVRLNVYQAFLLCAMKFHCYVYDLSSICNLQAVYYSEIIQKTFRYVHKLIWRTMHSISLGSNFHPILHLEKEEVEWLGLHAYIRVLNRKQSRHRELLSLLRSKLMMNVIMDRTSAQLIYAIDDSHSSVFWKIKY
ncbi:telomerase reverse transcriptase isoform X2 [Macadamia integrifolia]|uniref:telomerase reverse transcriptase isoform X2 n=2 Tax=Macadamia integrifolia TaxID=60698 RepID=UPI001C4E623B|nr:telomerase reverse transcriptase isoform X2 [Macadamia integrifolia]